MSKHRLPKSERYKGPSKWCQYLLARGLITVLQRLPIGLAYWLGCTIGWLCWKLLRRRREVVHCNLGIVNAWISQRSGLKSAALEGLSLERQVREVFLRSGANLFSGFTFARMSPERVAGHLEVEGLDYLKAALNHQAGAIILLAHMGPWETLAHLPAISQQYGVSAPFGALYRPLNNYYLEAWYKGQRQSLGTSLFSHMDGFHKPVSFLKNGGLLGVLADQKMRQGEVARFFGRLCKTNPLPGLLQRRSGAEVVSLSLYQVDVCKWKLEFRPVDFTSIEGERTRSNEALIANRCLEQMLSERPLDTFWFHNRFQ